MEATPGIEPGFTDLQSAASPLRHVASESENRGRGLYQNLAPGHNARRRANGLKLLRLPAVVPAFPLPVV